MYRTFKSITIFAILVGIIFSTFQANKVSAQSSGETSETNNNFSGYLIKLPQTRELVEIPEAIVTVAGEWAIVLPKEGQDALVKSFLDISGVQYQANRQVIPPPSSNVMYQSDAFNSDEISGRDQSVPDIETGLDGTFFYEQDWPFQKIGMRSLSSLNPIYNTDKPIVCVVDSAVDINRNEYVQRISNLSYNFTNIGRSPHSTSDLEGVHGTAVASLLLESLGSNSSLVEYVHLVALSDFYGGSEFGLASSIYYGADTGCDVFSMSLGFSSSEFDSPILDDAFNYAKSKGSVFIIAAGNDGGFVSYPANRYADIIVGAIDRGGVRPSWSNFPKNESELSRFVSAPGVNIVLDTPWVAYSGYDVGSGTSFSTPLVSSLVLQNMIMSGNSAQKAVFDVLASSRVGVSDENEYSDLVPYAYMSDLIPDVSRIMTEPAYIMGSGQITISAIVENVSTPPVLMDIEFGQIENQVEMTHLGANLYVGTLNVSNKFQNRYKGFWIKASNDFGSYSAMSPYVLLEGRNIPLGNIQVSSLTPNYLDNVEISLNYQGYYDFAWLGIFAHNKVPVWVPIRPLSVFNLNIGCDEEYDLVMYQAVGPNFVRLDDVELDVQNIPTDIRCPADSFLSLGSSSNIKHGQNHYVYAPGALSAASISYTIKTPVQLYSVSGKDVLNLYEYTYNLQVGDSVSILTFITDIYGTIYQLDEKNLVVVPSVYKLHFPFIRS